MGKNNPSASRILEINALISEGLATTVAFMVDRLNLLDTPAEKAFFLSCLADKLGSMREICMEAADEWAEFGLRDNSEENN